MSDYRDMLRDELERRLERNARYSLRAFSRDVGVAPSRLSEILRGVRGVSPANALRLTQRLGLAAAEREWFLTSVQALHARSRTLRQGAARKLATLGRGGALAARRESNALVGWYTGAVLAAARAAGRFVTTQGLAKRFGITPFQVEQALRYLVRLGYVPRESLSREAADAAGAAPVLGDGTARLRLLPAQVLAQAQAALAERTDAPRAFHALYLALDDARLAEARALLARTEAALEELAARAPSPPPREAPPVYAVTLTLHAVERPSS